MSDCPKPEKIQAYVDGELPGTEAAQIAEHISRCSHCAAVHRWLALISHNLSAQPRPEPSAELIDGIRRAVDLAEPVAQISCSDAQTLISVHLDGELTAKEQLLMWRHLFGCQACYQQFIQTQEITTALRRAQPVLVPADLEANVHKAVDAEIARRRVGIISLMRWRISKRAVAATVAAAAALLIGLLLIPQQPATKAPELARRPAQVSRPAEAPAVSVPPADVEKPPAIAQRMTSPRRTTATTAKPAQAPARKTETTVPVTTLSRPAPALPEKTVAPVSPALTSAGGKPPQPVFPVAPPTNTEQGPTLALYRAEPPPISPTTEKEPSQIKYTPVATAGESIYANLQPVAESRLEAAREEINERVAMNITYSKRPEVELAP